MKKNEVWEVQLEAVTERFCKKKFTKEDIQELGDSIVCWHRAMVLGGDVKGKDTAQWFGTICGILDDHNCKNIRKTMNCILVAMFGEMKAFMEQYVDYMLNKMEASNDKN